MKKVMVLAAMMIAGFAGAKNIVMIGDSTAGQSAGAKRYVIAPRACDFRAKLSLQDLSATLEVTVCLNGQEFWREVLNRDGQNSACKNLHLEKGVNEIELKVKHAHWQRQFAFEIERLNTLDSDDPAILKYTIENPAVWISGDTKAPEAPAPVLTRKFVLDEVPAQAELALAVAGYAEISVNGRRVDDVYMAPVTGQPDVNLPTLKREIAKFLKPGENEIEVLLGNGWYNCFTKDVWGFMRAKWHNEPDLGSPAIRGELTADGQTLLVTDATWRAYDSPIVFNALRSGEWYDARMEGIRWRERQAKVEPRAPLAVKFAAEDAAPCRASEPLAPVKSVSAKGGGTIYDFGSNRAGWCEIEVVGEPGAKVVMDYDESLQGGDDFKGHCIQFQTRPAEPRGGQHDEYTLKGDPKGEKWHARFTYHGFRYCRVRTVGKVKLRNITSWFVHSDFESVGSIETSDPAFARLQAATLRSYRSNFVGLPTDCPHREKNGWTGDASLACETGLWNYDAKAGYIHYLRIMLDSQQENGRVACILPTTHLFGYFWGTGPAWDAILFTIPRELYRFYGDDAMAREAYPAMKKYLEYAFSKRQPNGLFEYGLGDWCHPRRNGFKPVSTKLTDSAYVWSFCRDLAFWAERFGEKDVAEKCRARAKQLKADFNREFYRGKGVYEAGGLTALAAPLYFKGLCQDGEEKLVAEQLLAKARELKHGCWFGIQGAKWVPRALAEAGYIDDAYRFFTATGYPGYQLWFAEGEDTLWEAWEPESGDGSHNHIMYGDLSAWAYEYLAGIKILEPGFKKVEVKPYLPEGVDSFVISHRTPQGTIKVSASRGQDGKPVYKVEK